jgi:hypothetical protein
MKRIRIVTILLIIAVMAGCVSVPKDYTKFISANPRSILIVPVVNKSVEVTAADYMLSTISIPLAENGYYVFPVNLVKRIMEDEGLSDASLVHSSPTEKLCKMFGADAALYITVEKWDAQYLLLTTKVEVELKYQIRDGKTGETLWEDQQKMEYVPQNSGGGHPLATLIIMAVNAAMTKAAPNYIPLAKQANAKAFAYPGPGIPPGPYAADRKAEIAAAKAANNQNTINNQDSYNNN